MFVLNLGLASQPKRDFTIILNILKIKIILNYINHMFYKMIFLLLPEVRSVTISTSRVFLAKSPSIIACRRGSFNFWNEKIWHRLIVPCRSLMLWTTFHSSSEEGYVDVSFNYSFISLSIIYVMWVDNP